MKKIKRIFNKMCETHTFSALAIGLGCIALVATIFMSTLDKDTHKEKIQTELNDK